jgi:uncharacterized membrane protein YoaK (UPF0700 family)
VAGVALGGWLTLRAGLLSVALPAVAVAGVALVVRARLRRS